MSSAVLTEEEKKAAEAKAEEERKQAALDFQALLLPVQEKLRGLIFFNFTQTFEVKISDNSQGTVLAHVKLVNGTTLEISKEGWSAQPQDRFTIADPKFNPEKFAVRLSDYIQYNWMQNISESQRRTQNAIMQLKSALTNVANINP